jgi:hypothetical protein
VNGRVSYLLKEPVSSRVLAHFGLMKWSVFLWMNLWNRESCWGHRHQRAIFGYDSPRPA